VPSVPAQWTRMILRHVVRPRLDREDLPEQRRRMDSFGRRAWLPIGMRVEKVSIGGISGEWVIPVRADPTRAVLYLHGGGYSSGSCDSHRPLVARLARATGARVLHLNYRLAPEHPFPAAIEDATTAYRWLVAKGIPSSGIAIAGDSAGGGLTLATLIAVRDAGDPLPSAAACLSPWTDLALTGPSIGARGEEDPIFSPEGDGRALVRQYLGDSDPRAPLASPLYADLHGLPPLIVHVGDVEIILDDSTRLAERARAAGVDVTLKVWDGLWHVFQLVPWIPESRQSIEEIGDFIRDHAGRATVRLPFSPA
jgi:monoterpene epsilon-lactone hydrolase